MEDFIKSYGTCKKGFTLAEVLITLAIIGIVAALTIPSVVRNYQDTQLKTQFRKAYSTIQRAFEATNYDMGGRPQCYTDNNGSGTHYTTECPAFYEKLTEKLKVIKYCKNNAFAQGCMPQYEGYQGEDINDYQGFKESIMKVQNSAWVLADGTILIGYASPHSLFALDINGFKKPNKFGYDLFIFRIALNAKNVPLITPSGYIANIKAAGGKTTQEMFKWAFK